jgi:hypothetical protein
MPVEDFAESGGTEVDRKPYSRKRTCDLTTAAGMHCGEIASLQHCDHSLRKIGTHSLHAAHFVSVAMRHDDHIARLQLYRRPVSQANNPRPVDQKVINEQAQFRSVQLQALRWTYLGSAMTHPNFLATVGEFSPSVRKRIEEMAPVFS